MAACYLDSSASQELPVWGYGLRYKYGIFQQLISLDGEQLEVKLSNSMTGKPRNFFFRPPIRGWTTRTHGNYRDLMSHMISVFTAMQKE